MGKLLSLLARDDASTCCSPQKYDVYLDFENAQPTKGEEKTFAVVQKVLKNSETILDELQQYKGAGKEIREAISNPTEESQKKALQAVLPLVSKLKRFFEFSMELEAVVPQILSELCSGDMIPTQHLETQQALVKQFAEILEFVLKFDENKMKTPAIQNDFSYYRRTIARQRMSTSDDNGDESDVSTELANRMSLFLCSRNTHAQSALRCSVTVCLRENGHTHREHDRNLKHHGQGVSSDAGKSATDGAVPKGRNPAVCAASDGGPCHPLRPRAPPGCLRKGLKCGCERLCETAERTASSQIGRSAQRPQVHNKTPKRGRHAKEH